jgi:transposase
VQAPAPSRPIDRGLAGPGLLAHVLVSKYADHLPLYLYSHGYEFCFGLLWLVSRGTWTLVKWVAEPVDPRVFDNGSLFLCSIRGHRWVFLSWARSK